MFDLNQSFYLFIECLFYKFTKIIYHLFGCSSMCFKADDLISSLFSSLEIALIKK